MAQRSSTRSQTGTQERSTGGVTALVSGCRGDGQALDDNGTKGVSVLWISTAVAAQGRPIHAHVVVGWFGGLAAPLKSSSGR